MLVGYQLSWLEIFTAAVFVISILQGVQKTSVPVLQPGPIPWLEYGLSKYVVWVLPLASSRFLPCTCIWRISNTGYNTVSFWEPWSVHTWIRSWLYGLERLYTGLPQASALSRVLFNICTMGITSGQLEGPGRILSLRMMSLHTDSAKTEKTSLTAPRRNVIGWIDGAQITTTTFSPAKRGRYSAPSKTMQWT